MASYQSYIKSFGSPEAYAEAIKSRISSGKPFSDLAAAVQFQQDYPQYFTESEKLVPVRATFENKGLNVTYSPESKSVTVAHPDNPYTYKTSFTPTYTASGISYIPESQVKTIEQKVTPEYQTTYQELSGMFDDYMANLSKQTNSFINSMNSMVQQYGDMGLAMLKAYQDQYSQALAQMQKLMQPQTDVPESVKLAIQQLKEQTDENLKALDEEMIRRGIYRSGLAADMTQKLRKGQLDEEQQLLAQWLDQQHQQMYNATLQYANMLTNYASGLANVYQSAVMQPLQLGMSAAQTAYQLQSDLASKAFDTAKSLRTWLAEQRQSAQESALGYASEQAKAQQDYQKWLVEESRKQAAQESLDKYREALLGLRQQALDLRQQALEKGGSTSALLNLLGIALLSGGGTDVDDATLQELLNSSGVDIDTPQ